MSYPFNFRKTFSGNSSLSPPSFLPSFPVENHASVYRFSTNPTMKSFIPSFPRFPLQSSQFSFISSVPSSPYPSRLLIQTSSVSDHYLSSTGYSSALKLVRSMLPLPHLKEGNMTTTPVGNAIAPHRDWKRTEFFLNHEALQQAIKAEQKQVSWSLSGTIAEVTNEENSAIRVEIPDIVSVSSCADLTLPPGAGLCIDTTHGPIFWLLTRGNL